MSHITMLGTGNALATHCYNTCFTLHGPDPDSLLLVDAGGGNTILTQLERAEIPLDAIANLFVTHAHTDHLLGCIWMMRMALQKRHPLHVWSHRKVVDLLTYICRQILPPRQSGAITYADTPDPDAFVVMHTLQSADHFSVGSFRLQCFDILSTKEPQYGFTAILPDGQRLCCLGDEPFNDACRPYAECADWLMSEAFCLYDDRDRFHPYEKHHSTVLDAARLAQQLAVPNLILYHTEDKTLATRRQRYTAEARTAFTGRVCVPDDLERIDL